MANETAQPKLTTREALRARIREDIAPLDLDVRQSETLIFGLSDHALDLIKTKKQYRDGLPADDAFINPRQPIEGLFNAYKDRGLTINDAISLFSLHPARLTVPTEDLCSRIDAVIFSFKRGLLLGENILTPHNDKDALRTLFREKAGKSFLHLPTEQIYMSALYQTLHPASYASAPYMAITRADKARKILVPAPSLQAIMHMKKEARTKAVMEKLQKMAVSLWPDFTARAGITPPPAPAPAVTAPAAKPAKAPLSPDRLAMLKNIAAKVAQRKTAPGES